MNNVIKDLKPQKVFQFFEEISEIPRGSKNEKQISNYLLNFAKDRGLEVIQDDSFNIIIKKNATIGYENIPTIILQSHIDMVCTKDVHYNHDFTKDSIKLRIDGDYIKATGTTLGADNGIGMAYALAVLDLEEINHPNLEVIFTSDEETGMSGAKAIDCSMLCGKLMLNLDTEDEGEFCVSCAGGMRASLQIPCEFSGKQDNYIQYQIKVSGLVGGHSGIEINMGRANANVIIGRILNEINKNIDFSIININGGKFDNVITTESISNVCIKNEHENMFLNAIKELDNTIKNEYKTAEPNLVITAEKILVDFEKVLSKQCSKKVIDAIMLIPNGVQSMSLDVEGLVESSNNIGIIFQNENYIEISSLIRSSINSKKYYIFDKINTISEILGGKVVVSSEYPGFQYKKDSKIRELCENVYKDMYKKDAKIVSIHAGIEGGIFTEKVKDIDIISFGPTIHNAHSPQEEVSISSTQRVWEYLLQVLENSKECL